MNRLGTLVFPLAAVYLLGVIVQFFLAGLGVFGAESYDAHRVLGGILAIASLVLLVLAVGGRLGPRIMSLAAVLFVLNVLQVILANLDDVEWIQALHPVNGLAIVVVADTLLRRTRGYERAKMAA